MAWRPSLEKQSVAAPTPPKPPPTRSGGFGLSLSTFSAEARATLVGAQTRAATAGHAATEPAHLDAELAARFGWGDLAALESALASNAKGPTPAFSSELLGRLDVAEARAAAGARPVEPADLKTEAPDVAARSPAALPMDPMTRARIGDAAGPAAWLHALLDEPEVARAITLTGLHPDVLRADLRRAAAMEGTRALTLASGEATRAGREAISVRDLTMGILLSGALASEIRERRLFAVIVRSAFEVKLDEAQQQALRKSLGATPRWSFAAMRAAPLTAFMVLTAIAVTFSMEVGDHYAVLVLRRPVEALNLWQGVTSVFPHIGALHLIFNVSWMLLLGVPLERRRGSGLTAGFYLWSAFLSSVAQVAWSDAGVGLSGLLYGVAGYHWLVQLRDPSSPIVLSRGNAILLGGWLVACVALTELDILPVANMAHGMGLVTGLLAGWVATSRQRAIPLGLSAALTVGIVTWALL